MMPEPPPTPETGMLQKPGSQPELVQQPGRGSGDGDAFAGEQRAFEVDRVAAAAVAADAAAGREHTVARDHERQGVRRHHAPDTARGTRTTGHARELAVRDRLAPRHVTPQRVEHLAAEPVDAVEVEREVEVVARAPEPLVELAGDVVIAFA